MEEMYRSYIAGIRLDLQKYRQKYSYLVCYICSAEYLTDFGECHRKASPPI